VHQGEQVPASRLGLFVLHADGTETHLFPGMVSGASFSPDGTTVVFAPSLDLRRRGDDRGIYRIDADGGVPRPLVEPTSRYAPAFDRSFRTELYLPMFSPDGTQIAFFDGLGDSSQSLRVVNADGSDLRVLIDNIEGYRITNLDWSPDGKTLAFGIRINEGIYTIGVDGSGLTLVIPDGEDPHWSPDGTRISFDWEISARHVLYITDRDGSHIPSGVDHVSSGPWNPLVQPEPEATEMPAASEGMTMSSTLTLMAALLILAVGALVILRRMGPDAGNAI
jgi:Tol biopolymer transport system component